MTPTILVVEDEVAILKLLDLVLQHRGFMVTLAADGKKAIEIYQQQHHSIDLVLLDVQMEGLDGPATLARLHNINPNARCCFMSGHTGKYSTDDLFALGAVHVFTKPFKSMAQLAQKLWEVAARTE